MLSLYWKKKYPKREKCKVTKTFIGGLLNGEKQKNSFAAGKWSNKGKKLNL